MEMAEENTYGPAIYYGKLPSKFRNRIEFVSPFSVKKPIRNEVVDIETTFIDEKGFVIDGKPAIIEQLKRKNKPLLEREVSDLFKKECNGNIAVLEEPEITITDNGCRSGPGSRKICIDYVISVNGVAYKAEAVKTEFEKTGIIERIKTLSKNFF